MGRNNQQPSKPAITDINQVMTFGKFAGETVQDILDNDPGYLLWLDANTDIQIASHLLTEAEDANKPDHPFKNYTLRND